MRANVKKVIDLWLAGRAGSGDSKRTVWTDGTTVFSYEMAIATRRGGRYFVIERGEAPSATTRSQIDAVRSALKAENLPISFKHSFAGSVDARFAERTSVPVSRASLGRRSF